MASSMEEFSNALSRLHRTLIIGTAAVLAFALSPDPTEELVAAQQALVVIKTADILNYVRAVQTKYSAPEIFSEPWVQDLGAPDEKAATLRNCLQKSGVKFTYSLAVLAVPDLETETVAGLIEELTRGRVYWLQASADAIEGVLRKAGITCANAAFQKLAAIRMGTRNNEIKKSPSVRPEIRTISSLAMVKYRSKWPSNHKV